jgi:hypothetical protein
MLTNMIADIDKIRSGRKGPVIKNAGINKIKKENLFKNKL